MVFPIADRKPDGRRTSPVLVAKRRKVGAGETANAVAAPVSVDNTRWCAARQRRAV